MLLTLSSAPTNSISDSAKSGLAGTTRSRTTVPLGPANFAAQGTARSARADPSIGARTAVIHQSPARISVQRLLLTCEIPEKPVARKPRGRGQGAWFLEEMTGSRNECELRHGR